MFPESSAASVETRAPEILVVGGGKGGVGKTCFAVNVSVEIAKKGWRVVLFDADLGCSNVEAVLGVHTPVKLDQFFHQKGGKCLDRVLLTTQYENLRLIPGTTGLVEAANPKFQQKQTLIRQLGELDADLVVIDLDAGSHLNTLDFFLMSESCAVIVITPEKTSIDNAFKFLRAALFRRIERFYQSSEVAELLKRNESLTDFMECIRSSNAFPPDLAKQLCSELSAIARATRPRVVVNRCRNSYESQIAFNIFAKLSRQKLLIEPENLGYLYFDHCVQEAINAGTPFVVSHPRLGISGCVRDIVNRLGYF
jgi:flagellar biosynthesis protein FlhG